MNIDPIQLGILWDRLISITDEIVEALVRTSFSTNVRESYDLSCILFDKKGRSLAQGTYSMPTFTGTAPETLKHMLAKMPAETLRPGDVLFTNDPWLGTGHLFDVNVARPVFREDVLIGFTMTITHLPDIGGTGFSSVAREVYEEGLRIPICKICSAGALDERLVEIIRANVRVNDQVIGDIAANIVSNEVGARLLMELLDDYGLADLDDLADAIILQSEREMANAIERIPDGQYRNEMQIENADGMITLACAVTVKGREIAVDFAGTSGCVRAGFNVPLCYSSAMAQYSLKCLTLPEIPNNWGSIAPIRVTGPEGCILNAQLPWPTAGRHVIGHFVLPLIFGALSSVVKDRVHADPGMIDLLNFQGRHRDGSGVSSIYFAAGGYGAFHDADGPSVTPSPSNMSGISTEVWEQQTSVTIEEKSLLVDSGGAGKQRGGLGQQFVLRNDSRDVMIVSAFAQRTEIAPAGFQGGKPGRHRAHLLNGKPVHAQRRYVLQVGDRLTAIQCGGGGFGDPAFRPVAAVVEDWGNGFVSAAGALRDYGVRIDESTGSGARDSS